MKHFLLLTLICFLSLSSKAQNPAYTIHESLLGNDWTVNQKTLFSYDSTGKEIMRLEQLVANGAWVDDLKEESAYDASGKLNQFIAYKWNDANQTWQGWLRRTYSYNSNGQLTHRLDEMWGNNAWQNESYIEKTYDQSGFCTLFSAKKWDNVSSNWINYAQISYTSDGQGRISQHTTSYFGSLWGPGETWHAKIRSNITYTPSGLIATQRDEDWKSSNWIDSNLVVNTYDANEVLLSKEERRKDELNNWKNGFITYYTYNANGTVHKPSFYL